MPELERRFAPVELRAVDTADPHITGRAIVFGQWSEEMYGFRETIAPGALAACDMVDVTLLFNHSPDTVMARTTSGTLGLSESQEGLDFDGAVDPADPDVARLIPKMRRGDVSQCSFAFTVSQDRWASDETGRSTREILAIDKLYDVSVVTNPAYPQTSAQVRKIAERIAEVRSMDLDELPEDLCGLDISITTRAGKVLSSANFDKISQARDLLGEVIASAQNNSDPNGGEAPEGPGDAPGTGARLRAIALNRNHERKGQR